MQIALITDTHYGIRNSSPIFFDYFKKSLDVFFDTIDARGIKHVIHLGDLFDQRKYVNLLTAQRCRTDFLDRLESRQIETHIIAGNHDTFYKNTNDINSLREFVAGRYKYIKIYEKPEVIEIDGLPIQLMPWIPNEFDEDVVRAIKASPSDILMGHLELFGFEMFTGSVATHGMNRDTFSRYDMVFTGHYHHKSTVGNVYYLGSFAQFTWSDYNDPRGFHIFDTNTRELEFIENTNTLFHMISYNDSNDAGLAKISKIDAESYSGVYLKVVVSKKTNPYLFDKTIEKLHDAGPIGITIVESDDPFDSENIEAPSIDAVKDTPSIIKDYVSNLTFTVEPDRVVNYLISIYNDALSADKAI